MQIAGIIVEYNPMHAGHLHLLEETRARLGADTAIIGVMSGNFVQRGDFALLRKQSRARAAVESGVDLVLELPLPWAVSSAERFADGGVCTLAATGLATHLAFGCECGDGDRLRRLAAALTDAEFSRQLKAELRAGDSFAAARQRAVGGLVSPEDAACLASPNNILGVEYCKSLLRHGSSLQMVAVTREGTPHDGALEADAHPSATALRGLIRAGERARALELLPPAMRAVYEEEERAGRAPVFAETCQRALLARLRTMTETDFARLDQGREGLYHRLYAASRTASSLPELLAAAKTKRYAYARLRRMVLWAYLGLDPACQLDEVPYLRPLAANGVGRTLLARMRQTASVPILTKPADVRRLSEPAKALFAQEVRATDLYTLAYPELTAAKGGTEWREGPAIL